MIHRKLLISVIGLTVIVCFCIVMGWCHTEQQGSVSIYELLKQKAKTHNWRTLLVGWDRLVMFDFGLHEPMFVYQLQRGSSGYYEANIEGGVLSPDASRVAFAQKDDKLRKTNLYVLDVTSRRMEHLLRTDEIDGIAWSPDSQKIAYVDAAAHNKQLELNVFDLSSKQSKSLLQGGHYVITSQAWSPDGHQLVYGLSQNKGETQLLMIYDLTSKTSRRLAASGRWATWSPTGEWIAYLAFDEKGAASIRLINPVGQRDISLLQDITPSSVDAIVSAPLWSPDGAYLLYGRIHPEEPEAMRSYVSELATRREEALPDEIYWAHSFAGKR